MKYKIYRYSLSSRDGRVIHPDKHFEIFRKATGPDAYGRYAEYRGQKNAVLMNVRDVGPDFIGLVGKHSTEREITQYQEREDEARIVYVSDNDYPHTAFVCMPRLGAIAIADSSQIKANSAIGRLHAIIAAREAIFFTAEVIKEAYDLRLAVSRFRVFEVQYEIRPVNPHSGDLGKELDESRKLDHIKRMAGKVHSGEGDGLKMEGGFLTAVSDLQRSGHARVGYRAEADNGLIVDVQKPSKSDVEAYSGDEGEGTPEVEVRIDFADIKLAWPLTQAHVTALRKLARALTTLEKE